MRHFRRFARLMLRERGALVASFVFAMISAGGLGAGLVSMAPLLRLILKPGASLAAEVAQINATRLGGAIPQELIERLPEDRMDGVVVLLGALVVLTILGAAANFAHEFLATSISARTAAEVRDEAFRTALRLPMRTIVERGPAEFVARIVRDVAELQRGFTVLTSKSVAQVTKGFAAFVAALVIDWKLTLAACVVAPAMAVLLRKLGKRIRRGARGALQAQEELLRTSVETLQGLRSVKAARAERAALGRFRRANAATLRSELRVRTVRALGGPVMELLAVVALCALAAFAARQIIEGALSPERFVGALAALGVAGSSLKPMASLVGEIQAAEAPAERLAQVVDSPTEARGRGLPALPPPSRDLRFERVRLRYPGAAEDALREVSLVVPHGQWVALVGPNGCGKTTLAALVPRLLTPDEGAVLIDGIDVATVRLASLRSQVAVVSQEVVLFRGTIAENIGFGLAGASREAIVDAARRAHAAEFILAMPGGYDAPVAELGASLSGGQRQRLAIARAILRDPAILILDEATSQIDPESERQINEALEELRAGRTLLTIAHRVASMRAADRIVVMDAGRIVDDGTHEELLGRCELYQRLAGDEAP